MTMSEELFDTNQTEFSSQQPILDRDYEPVFDEKPKESRPWYKQTLIIAVIAGGFLILILLVLLMMPVKQDKTTEQPDEQLPIGEVDQSDPMVQRLNRLRTDLNNADPTKSDLVFPLVDMKLKLDD